MLTLDGRVAVVVAGILASGALSGVLLAQPNPRGMLLVGALALAALTVVAFETPIAAFAGLALIIGVASEAVEDDRLLGVNDLVYGRVVSIFSLPIILVGLLAVVLALTLSSAHAVWPGASATVAVGLLGIALGNAAWFGSFEEGLLVVRPLAVLVLAILVGYWISLRYGADIPLKVLVVAAMLAIPFGLHNVTSGDISYYDASFVYLIGVSAVLVLFRAVEIGFLRVPFLVLSAFVIVVSLRRGAILAVAITILITGILVGRGTFRMVVAVTAGVVIAAELFAPGVVLARVEGVVNYFTGASGQDFSVNYRRYELTNAWANVERHWVWGIGPTEDWTVYRTFDGKFERIDDGDYLHNSYLWVWLRYGLLGLAAYVAFLAVSALTLVRRGAPVVAVIVGASIIGLAATLATASYLTTTLRWPLIVGLFLGIALAAVREDASSGDLVAERSVT